MHFLRSQPSHYFPSLSISAHLSILGTELTAVLLEEYIQFLFVHWRLRGVYQIAQWLLVEVVRGDIQPPLVLSEAVECCVFISACDSNELPYLATLGLLQLVLGSEGEGGGKGEQEGERKGPGSSRKVKTTLIHVVATEEDRKQPILKGLRE